MDFGGLLTDDDHKRVMAKLMLLEDEAVLARNLTKSFDRQGIVARHAATVDELTEGTGGG